MAGADGQLCGFLPQQENFEFGKLCPEVRQPLEMPLVYKHIVTVAS